MLRTLIEGPPLFGLFALPASTSWPAAAARLVMPRRHGESANCPAPSTSSSSVMAGLGNRRPGTPSDRQPSAGTVKAPFRFPFRKLGWKGYNWDRNRKAGNAGFLGVSWGELVPVAGYIGFGTKRSPVQIWARERASSRCMKEGKKLCVLDTDG